MKISSAMRALALPLVLLAAVPARAGAPAPDPNTLPKVECSSLKFGKAWLEQYPKVPAACLEARLYKGAKYARFQGKVRGVEKNSLTLTLLNEVGDPLSTLTFKPALNALVLVEGKPKYYKDLSVGDVLTVWVPETRFTVLTSPTATTGVSSGLPPKS